MQREIWFRHSVELTRARDGADGQAEYRQVQAEEHNLVSGGILSMISPVSDTFK
jgi:hypothetical protein